MNNPVYLDYNATTPVAPDVVDAMAEALRHVYGNPSSGYANGKDAANRMDFARGQVADLVGARSSAIVFTGCATESNNLALLGVAASRSEPGHLIISAVEHPAVTAPARHLETQGWRLTVLPVDTTGRVSAQQVADALCPNTVLVSVMLANNEVGTVQPIADIGRVLRDSGILFHTDAAQAVGKIPVDVDSLGVDLLTIAGHKFRASKGVGALYVRPGTRIQRITHGAGHEQGLRPGTENVPAIVGLGVAAELASRHLGGADNRLTKHRDQLHAALRAGVPGLLLNGHPEHRLPNTLHVSFPGVSGQALLDMASGVVMASVGSACHSGSAAPSGVLGAMGLDADRAQGAVRLSVGWETTASEIDRAAQALIEAWQRLSANA